jgi:electron transfer flavoprotein alpha/beta subunit
MSCSCDMSAVEEALRLRTKHAKSTTAAKVDKITVVTIGGAKCAETLRTGLAMGAVSTRILHPSLSSGNQADVSNKVELERFPPQPT